MTWYYWFWVTIYHHRVACGCLLCSWRHFFYPKFKTFFTAWLHIPYSNGEWLMCNYVVAFSPG